MLEKRGNRRSIMRDVLNKHLFTSDADDTDADGSWDVEDGGRFRQRPRGDPVMFPGWLIS